MAHVITKCHHFRTDDSCRWCDEGFIPSPNADDSDCQYKDCTRRYDVKCIKNA